MCKKVAENGGKKRKKLSSEFSEMSLEILKDLKEKMFIFLILDVEAITVVQA